jgi:hypothetical protein
LDSFNKFLEVLTNEFPNVLPLYKKAYHKIKVVPKVVLSSKAFYRLNEKELEDLKK